MLENYININFVSCFDNQIKALTDDIDLILRSMGSSTTVEVQVNS